MLESNISTLLRNQRLQAGVTQEELAARSGVSARTISRIENGLHRPRPTTLRELGIALCPPESAAEPLPAVMQSAVPEQRTGPGMRSFLPPGPGTLVGREREAANLQLAMATAAGHKASIFLIDGMPGVGKTAFALHIADSMTARFPDAQYYVDLHGFTPGRAPVTTREALERLGPMAGLHESRIPTALEGQSALWRSTLAAQRSILVLENAADADQVLPLLPGTADCLVLVTSRRYLSIPSSALSVSLGALPPDQAIELFRQTVGPQQRIDEPEAVAEIVELCGRLPLAIWIAAIRVVRRPSWTVRQFATRLRNSSCRLVELAVDNQDVASAFGMSYRRLDPAARRAFRLLALHAGTSFELDAVADLIDATPEEAYRLVETLVDHHLLLQHSFTQYGFHCLLREFAARTS